METKSEANQPTEATPKNKPCPVCGEPIFSGALKCKHCDEFLDGYRDQTGFIYRKKRPRWGIKDKRVWDWVSLLFIPIVLAGIGFGFAFWQDALQSSIEDNRIAAQSTVQADRVQEAALQAYLDKMTDLMLSESSFTDEQYSRLQAIARSRTLTLLGSLDPKRKAATITFLYEAGSLSQPQSITETLTESTIVIPLADANLVEVDLEWANLSGIDLSEADLSEAWLQGTNLDGAYLRGANLRGAFLLGAYLREADLCRAWLSSNLAGAKLEGANLRMANLRRANLFGANLDGAKLEGAILREAILCWANLDGANLDGAILEGAIYDGNTIWPENFDVEAENTIKVDQSRCFEIRTQYKPYDLSLVPPIVELDVPVVSCSP